MKPRLLALLLLLTACAATQAVGQIVVVRNPSGTPVPCAPPGLKLGALPACGAGSAFQAAAFSMGFSSPAGGKATPSDVSLSKLVDNTSSTMLIDMLSAKSLGNVLISLYTTADIVAAGTTGKPVASVSILLTGTVVTSTQQAVASYPSSESVSFAYSTMKYTYSLHNGSAAPVPYTVTYNHLTNKAS